MQQSNAELWLSARHPELFDAKGGAEYAASQCMALSFRRTTLPIQLVDPPKHLPVYRKRQECAIQVWLELTESNLCAARSFRLYGQHNDSGQDRPVRHLVEPADREHIRVGHARYERISSDEVKVGLRTSQ